MPHTTFMSHAHADNAICAQYAAALRARGIEVWIDLVDAQAGHSLSGGITQQLERSSAFLLMVTAASNSSYWVELERDNFIHLWADRATHVMQGRERVILPVMLDGSPIPASVRGFLGIDAVSKPFAQVVNEIARALGAAGDRPPPPPQQMQISIGGQSHWSVTAAKGRTTRGQRPQRIGGRPHWLVPVSALALVIATFLPWYTVSVDPVTVSGQQVSAGYSVSVNAWSYWAGSMVGIVGFITLIYTALRYFKAQAPAIPFRDKLIYRVLSVAAVLFGLIYLTIGGSLSPYYYSGLHVRPGYGLYIGLVAALAIGAGAG